MTSFALFLRLCLICILFFSVLSCTICVLNFVIEDLLVRATALYFSCGSFVAMVDGAVAIVAEFAARSK